MAVLAVPRGRQMTVTAGCCSWRTTAAAWATASAMFTCTFSSLILWISLERLSCSRACRAEGSSEEDG